MVDDRSLVCSVKQASNGAEKVILSVADLVCNTTREYGITEMRLVDHTMTAKMQVSLVQKNIVKILSLQIPATLFWVSPFEIWLALVPCGLVSKLSNISWIGAWRRQPSATELQVRHSATGKDQCL